VNSLIMVVTAIMSMVVTATGTVTAMAETIQPAASDDPMATAAPVAPAAATVAVDTALAVDITVAKVARVDTAVIMVARVARVAKEGIIEEETLAASLPTTVEAVPLPSTLPIRTAVTMAVVAVVTDTDTARRTAVVAAAAEIVEERITIMVTDRLMAVARWEGITTLFNFFLSFVTCSMNQKPKTKRTRLFFSNEEGILFQMCTCSFIHSFITCNAPRTTKIHSHSYKKK